MNFGKKYIIFIKMWSSRIKNMQHKKKQYMTSEQKQPLVSVIVPNYNHARYLEQRLDSVFGQTYKNFEVVILDDCSTDNSLEVINRYKNNPHLSQIVVNETNSGNTFKQWDKGFNLAKGELIWIAESDDYCELNMLEELVGAYTNRSEMVLAYTTSIIVGNEGEKCIPSKYKLGTKILEGKDFITRCLIVGNVIQNASSAIFNKNALKNITPEYKSFHGAGDYLFWTQIAGQGSVAIVDQQLNYFRCAGNSVTRRNFSSGMAAIEDMKVYQYIREHYNISWLHNRICYASHAAMFRDVAYDSESAQKGSYDLWQIDRYSGWFDKKLLWLRGSLIRHLGYYI